MCCYQECRFVCRSYRISGSVRQRDRLARRGRYQRPGRKCRRTGAIMAAHAAKPEIGGKRLERYFDRIDLPTTDRQRIQADDLGLKTLTAICKAHVQSIPFENLDLVYGPAKAVSGGEIKIDTNSVFEKLVVRRRGGYCFEINALLALALRGVGYSDKVYTAAGRVVQERKSQSEVELGGIDHQVVIVDCDSRKWVCDAGFGGQTCRAPVLLQDVAAGTKGGDAGTHRVRRGVLGSSLPPGEISAPQREGWYMQRYSQGRQRWDDLYFFTEQEWREVDYRIPNFWCSNRHPLFCKKLVVAIQTEDGRKTILGSKLRIAGAGSSAEEDLTETSDLKQALQHHFGLAL